MCQFRIGKVPLIWSMIPGKAIQHIQRRVVRSITSVESENHCSSKAVASTTRVHEEGLSAVPLRPRAS
ncbi:hypothetical protein TNCV_1968631 [Trichonephila clavipes]|nr:hypothetical protein TNCV_1968631 [Trichonephila clavipes]